MFKNMKIGTKFVFLDACVGVLILLMTAMLFFAPMRALNGIEKKLTEMTTANGGSAISVDAVTQVVTSQRATVTTQMIIMCAICVVIGAILITVYGIVVHRIGKGARLTTGNLGHLSDKDLAYKPGIMGGRDEMGTMSAASKKVYDVLSGIMGTLKDTSEQLSENASVMATSAEEVSESASQISDAIGDIASSMSGQAADTESAATQVEVLGNIVTKSSETAEHLQEASSNITKATMEGMFVVEQLQRDTDSSNEAFENIFAVIQEMNSSAKKIGEASGLIADIAQQTNLLSLNASIEAARAGEAGRGFAVVAEQIRQLAEQSASSVSTIDNMVSTLQANVKKAVAQSDLVKEAVNVQKEGVEKTEAQYKIIVNAVGDVNTEIKSLKTISDEMGESCQAVVDAVANLSASAEECSATTEETSASTDVILASIQNVNEISQSINNLSQELQGVIAEFKF